MNTHPVGVFMFNPMFNVQGSRGKTMSDEIRSRRDDIEGLLDRSTPSFNDKADDRALAQVLTLLEIVDAIDNLADVIETTARGLADRADRDL